MSEKRVLLIDDDEDLSYIITDMLESYGDRAVIFTTISPNATIFSCPSKPYALRNNAFYLLEAGK